MTAVLDPDRTLVLSYVPAARREAVRALWQLDATLGAILSYGRDATISQIRLAWWREAVERLDQAPPPAEPVLQALAEHVLPRGVTGASLAALEEGWRRLLVPGPLSGEDMAAYAAHRGGLLFRLTARILSQADLPVEAAGEGWALVDLARHSGGSDAAQALAVAQARLASVNVDRWRGPLKPLGMLAVLALRDAGAMSLERQGSPARMLRMLRMRLTGR